MACEWGHLAVAEIIMMKSLELKIDLNARHKRGKTAFPMACKRGWTNIVNMLIQNEEIFKLDITWRDENGNTGMQFAEKIKRLKELARPEEQGRQSRDGRGGDRSLIIFSKNWHILPEV